MIKKIIDNTIGFITFSLLILNTIICVGLLNPVYYLKYFTKNEKLKIKYTKIITKISYTWVEINNFLLHITQNIQWDISIDDSSYKQELAMDKWYLMTSNHQSWIDIVVLQKVYNKIVPFPKFFLKKELKWVPVLGIAWMALDYPFMKRHSKTEIKKNPSLKSDDFNTAKKACSIYKGSPATIMNFLEGTRFTQKKRVIKKSPFQNLLIPKAGGIAIVFSEMGEMLSAILDVTIIYPQKNIQFKDLFCRNIKRIVVNAKLREVPKQFIGKDYINDKDFKIEIQSWLNEIWQEKDKLMTDTLNKSKEQV